VSRRPAGRRRSLARPLAGLGVLPWPTPAAACATCLDAAFGDRGFNIALLGLMLMPFAVAAVIAGVLAWNSPRRQRESPLAREEGERC
jgi:hypothetical protein